MQLPYNLKKLSAGQPGKKSILHITHALGGVQTYLEYVLLYNDNNEFEHSIAAPANTGFQGFCAGLVKNYYPLKVKREVNLFSDIFLLVKLVRIIKKQRPDILHVHSAKGGFIGRLAGKFSKAKIIYTPHGFSYLSFTGKKRMFYFMLESISRNWSDTLLAVSQSEANRALHELGYRKDRVKVIMNAVKAPGENSVRNYNVYNRIGMIGRLTAQKNPMLFLEIAKAMLGKHPQLQFSILGAGLNDHLGEMLTEFIGKNKLEAKIQLLPWGDAETGKVFIEGTDIYVMTSVFEGLPYSLLEAMRSGCPCVVSNADGNIDVVQNNKTGFTCVGIEDYCTAIEKLVSDRSLREKIGQAGRCRVEEKHNIKITAAQLHDIYHNL